MRVWMADDMADVHVSVYEFLSKYTREHRCINRGIMKKSALKTGTRSCTPVYSYAFDNVGHRKKANEFVQTGSKYRIKYNMLCTNFDYVYKILQ